MTDVDDAPAPPRPTRCVHCADDELTLVARKTYSSPDELDEYTYACAAHGHEFTWTEASVEKPAETALTLDGLIDAARRLRRRHGGHVRVLAWRRAVEGRESMLADVVSIDYDVFEPGGPTFAVVDVSEKERDDE